VGHHWVEQGNAIIFRDEDIAWMRIGMEETVNRIV
jgi:hypothetical protein